MAFVPLKFKSGIVTDITPYSNEGGFVDCDKIRFRLGTPEKMGGWSKYATNTFQGAARRLHNWVALDGSDFLGIGTHLKYYIEEGQTFSDITPIRNTTSAGDITFSATNGSATITVNDPAHGANENDFVTFSGAASLGGNITANVLNKEYQIVALISSNAYQITASLAANSSDSGNGGGSIVGTYQLNTGLNTTVGGTGWGAGQWSGTTSSALSTTLNEALDNSETGVDVVDETGMNTANDVVLIGNELMLISATTDDNTMTVTRGHSGTTATTHENGSLVRLALGNTLATDDFVGWGSAASITVPGAQIRLWSHDNFGEDLIINPRDGGLYYWDRSLGLGGKAIELSQSGLSGTRTSVPQIAKQIIVSDSDRHIIAFGCDGLGTTAGATQGSGVQDPLLIRFSSQENPVDWFPTTTNTAGDLRLGGGSTFVQAVETKQEILVFTNKSLHSLKFIGPPFTFGIRELSKNITIMSPASAIAIDDSVYWMGVDTFYIYSGGATQQIPCSVKDKVFLNFNLEEKDKVHVGVNSEFSEVIWFYPSADVTEVDSYVTYNYAESAWYFGTLSRQAWLDRGIRNLPIATGDQYLYNHEVGYDDDGSAMTSFVESAPMRFSQDESFSFVNRIIPDVNFSGSTSINPSVDFTLKAQTFSGSGITQTSSGSTQRSSTSPVETYTEKLDFRVRGRTFALRLESTGLGTKFKLGTPQVNIKEDGKR
jgi:hypothetical protein